MSLGTLRDTDIATDSPISHFNSLSSSSFSSPWESGAFQLIPIPIVIESHCDAYCLPLKSVSSLRLSSFVLCVFHHRMAMYPLGGASIHNCFLFLDHHRIIWIWEWGGRMVRQFFEFCLYSLFFLLIRERFGWLDGTLVWCIQGGIDRTRLPLKQTYKWR